MRICAGSAPEIREISVVAAFLLAAAAGDSLVGADGILDVFQLSAAGQLVGTDTIRGDDCGSIDIIAVQVDTTLAAADVANVRNVDRTTIAATGGACATIANAMADGGDLACFQGFSGDGGEGDGRILGSVGNDLLRGDAVSDWIAAGTGNDTLRLVAIRLGDVQTFGSGKGFTLVNLDLV